MRVSSIGEYIKEQREQAKISLRQLAAAAGVSNPYLSQIERGLRRPSAEILQQIAKGLRISAEALYVQAGILEDRPADSGVRAAVLAEPDLTERQKHVLLEIYDSFRKEAAAAKAAEAATDVAVAAGSPPGATAARVGDPSDPADRPAAQRAHARRAVLDDEDDDDPLAVAEPLSAHDAAPHAQVPAPGAATPPGPSGADEADPAVKGRPGQAGQEG
jgi:transcriptional regulator with XRE-family HTH domain